MGMDIHIHIEYRSKRNGEWRCGDYFKINYEPYGDEPKFEPVEICGERNYHRFAVLADMLPANILLKLKSLIPMATDNAPITPAVGVFTQVRHRSEPIQRGES